MKAPKVLIFTITYKGKDYCFNEFIARANTINYPNKKHIIIDNTADDGLQYYKTLKKRLRNKDYHVYHVERGNNSREALSRSQNFARKIALDEGYDYMLSLESDIMCTPDVVQKLMVHVKPVVTALYHIGDRSKGIRVPCITLAEFRKDIGAWGTRLLKVEEHKDYTRNGLKQVQAGGMGCTLIRRDILERFSFYYDPRFQGHSDIYFFNNLFQSKIPVFTDTDLVLDHQNVNWNTVEDR